MQNENKYYVEIEYLIKRNEVNKTSRLIKNNTDTITTYWNVGRLIVEAQGGKSYAAYGNGLIKEWSKRLTLFYGKGYNDSELRRFRKFYLTFPICAPVVPTLSWSHIRIILPFSDENKRNYYINLVTTRNLSKRELINEIKNNAYERLLDKPAYIPIIDNKNTYNIKEHIKNPIIIKLNQYDKILNEHDLQVKILAELKNFFQELGEGYTFVGNEYKINYGSKNYFIDILLFNYKLNCFIVVELKLRELKK